MMKCKFEHDGDCCNSGAAQYMCKCKQPCYEIIPITNADRIRAMSDEELANRMYWYHAGSDAIPFCKNLPECGKMIDEGSEIPDEKCIRCMLDWLKRPAEKI